MMIDTHCHLYAKEFEGDIDAVIQRALENGIEKFYLPAIDSETTAGMLSLEAKYPGKCFSMIGLHPCSVKENFEDELYKIEQLLATRKFAAIGETGLDFYWDKSFVKEQALVLKRQAELAIQYKIPIVLHTRDAMQETIDIIKNFAANGLQGIFHCFGGSMNEAQQIIDMGFYMGIGGVVTYKKSGLENVLAQIDLKHIVLETDAPYLAPVPFRGKRNESSYLKMIAQKISEIKNVPVEDVESITTENSNKIFNGAGTP